MNRLLLALVPFLFIVQYSTSQDVDEIHDLPGFGRIEKDDGLVLFDFERDTTYFEGEEIKKFEPIENRDYVPLVAVHKKRGYTIASGFYSPLRVYPHFIIEDHEISDNHFSGNQSISPFGVKIDGKWGIMDARTMKFLLPPEYDEIDWSFDSYYNYVLLEKDKKQGVVDLRKLAIEETGENAMVLPLSYDKIAMEDEVIRTETDKLHGIAFQGRDGLIKIPAVLEESPSWDFIDVATPQFNLPAMIDGQEKRCYYDRDSGLTCYDDIIIPDWGFGEVHIFVDGDTMTLGDTYKPIFSGPFESIELANPDGFYLTTIDGKVGLRDPLGKVVIPEKFSSLALHDDRTEFVISEVDGKYGVYVHNEELIPPMYDEIEVGRSFIYVRKDKLWGLASQETGELVVECKHKKKIDAENELDGQ